MRDACPIRREVYCQSSPSALLIRAIPTVKSMPTHDGVSHALAALHNYKARIPPLSALPVLSMSHSCCFPLPFNTRHPFRRLLRHPSSVLGAPTTSSQTPQ